VDFTFIVPGAQFGRQGTAAQHGIYGDRHIVVDS
jgi:hypothetical protein